MVPKRSFPFLGEGKGVIRGGICEDRTWRSEGCNQDVKMNKLINWKKKQSRQDGTFLIPAFRTQGQKDLLSLKAA